MASGAWGHGDFVGTGALGLGALGAMCALGALDNQWGLRVKRCWGGIGGSKALKAPGHSEPQSPYDPQAQLSTQALKTRGRQHFSNPNPN